MIQHQEIPRFVRVKSVRSSTLLSAETNLPIIWSARAAITLIILRRKKFDRLPINLALSINIVAAATRSSLPLSLIDHLTSARPRLRYVCVPACKATRRSVPPITANPRATLPRLQSAPSSSSLSIAIRSHAFGEDAAGAHVYWRSPAVSRGRKAIPRQPLIILSAAISRRGSQLKNSAFDSWPTNTPISSPFLHPSYISPRNLSGYFPTTIAE